MYSTSISSSAQKRMKTQQKRSLSVRRRLVRSLLGNFTVSESFWFKRRLLVHLRLGYLNPPTSTVCDVPGTSLQNHLSDVRRYQGNQDSGPGKFLTEAFQIESPWVCKIWWSHRDSSTNFCLSCRIMGSVRPSVCRFHIVVAESQYSDIYLLARSVSWRV